MGRLREIAEAMAEAVDEDEAVVANGGVVCIVEDKANVAFDVSKELAAGGLAVVFAATGFDRRGNSGPVLSGTARIEATVYENPELNRGGDTSRWTAQGCAENVARILHWRALTGLVNGPIRLEGISRDDVDAANIVRMRFVAETSIPTS